MTNPNNTDLQVRRHGTQKFEIKPAVELHVSHLVALPDDPENKRDYVEIREYNTDAEIYGHGLLIPLNLSGFVSLAVEEVADDR